VPRSASCSRPTALSELRAATAGLCATLVGIGLARFAYTPLLPALIEGGWFSPPDAAYLAAANLVGYLVGAVGARPVMSRMRPTRLVRLMMLLATATFLACALRLGFPWFVFWRFLSGLSGGLLMVAVAPTVLAVIHAERRGRIGGIMFAGVGIGIVASGTLVPQLLRVGLVTTWLGLGALSLALTLLAWSRWPDDAPLPGRAAASGSGLGRPILAVCGVYALFALGLVPHMVFLVDFIARGLGWGVTVGATFWVVYGLGAVCGPFVAGWLGDRIGFGPALSVALGLQLGVVLIPLLAPLTLPLAISALVMGAFTPGMPTLVLGRLAEITAGRDQHGAWAFATTAYALTQAGGAYAMSWLYARSHGYDALFIAAAMALVLALTLSVATGRRPRTSPPS
jgi:predicted MFS family arabinose efflux permease